MGSICSGIANTEKKNDFALSGKCGICRKKLRFPIDLGCGDSFCYVCLKKWIETSSSCPLCCQEIKERDVGNINMYVYSVLSKYNVSDAVRLFFKSIFVSDSVLKKTEYSQFFMSFLSLYEENIQSIVNYCNTNYDSAKKDLYPIILLCSFKSYEDFIKLVEDVLSLAQVFSRYYSFVFPPLGNETLIPNIRYEYLACISKLSLHKVELLYGLVNIWERHKRVDLTPFCTLISEMNENQYKLFCKYVFDLGFDSWNDTYHIYRVIKQSTQEDLLKLLLADCYPYERWNNTYRSRFSLFSLFISKTEEEVEEFVRNVDWIHNLDANTISNLEQLATKALEATHCS